MCLICKNLRRRSWSLDDCVASLLHHWDEMDEVHREELWLWLYDVCVDDCRYDLVRAMLD